MIGRRYGSAAHNCPQRRADDSTDGLSQLATDPLGYNEQDAFVRQAVVSDEAFQGAMWREIGRGTENPNVGVFVDTRPFGPTARFFPAVRGSGCGSAARECAEVGAT